MAGWESNEVEHTFSSGRTMTIRKALSLQWLVMRAIEQEDVELSAGLSEWFEDGTIDGSAGPSEMDKIRLGAKVERAIVEAMFIRPRVWWDPEDVPEAPPPPEGEPPYHLAAVSMQDSELSEALELAMKGVAEASRFRDESDGAQRGKGGKGVGAKPKPSARSGARKR